MTDDPLQQLKRLIGTRYPDSRLEQLTETDLRQLKTDHPGIPDHLLSFYREIGCGRIGQSRYMIHFATYPNEIYDEETASNLGNILIVGDDYAGDCDGYAIDHDWSFGSIDSCGEFNVSEDDLPTISHWLLSMLGD